MICGREMATALRDLRGFTNDTVQNLISTGNTTVHGPQVADTEWVKLVVDKTHMVVYLLRAARQVCINLEALLSLLSNDGTIRRLYTQGIDLLRLIGADDLGHNPILRVGGQQMAYLALPGVDVVFVRGSLKARWPNTAHRMSETSASPCTAGTARTANRNHNAAISTTKISKLPK